MTTPTREQFKSAAKFAGMELHHWGEDDGDLVFVFNDSCTDSPGGYWEPHKPSADAFRLLVKVQKWYATSDDAQDSAIESQWDDYCAAKRSGNPEQLALATFNLAAEIGRGME